LRRLGTERRSRCQMGASRPVGSHRRTCTAAG
jgi:hypothetical protein